MSPQAGNSAGNLALSASGECKIYSRENTVRNILLMGLGEFPRGWGAGILLVTRLVMVSRPAGKSAGDSRLYRIRHCSFHVGR